MSDTTARRRMIEKIRPALAYDYHVNNMLAKKVSKIHGVSEGAAYTAKEMYTKKEIYNLHGDNESILIVPKSMLEFAEAALEKVGIQFRLASKNHELIEVFESSMNRKL